MSGKTAFVTGGTGFVGLNVVKQLTGAGWSVTALHRASSDLTYLDAFPATLVEGSITDIGSLRRAMPDGVDVVFHIAGNLNLWARRNAEQTRDNVEGTANMVEVALEKKAGRFVQTSSIQAYGMARGTITEEAEQLGRVSWVNYQRTKFLGEEEVRKGIARGLDAVIVNPAGIIGAHDRAGWARAFRLLHAGKLPGIPPGTGSFCHVREVAAAHIAAAERGRTGENYLLGGADASYLEMIRIAGEIMGKKAPGRPTPAWLMRIVGRAGPWMSALSGKAPVLTPETVGLTTRRLVCDCSKAERELGYQRVPLREMIAESVAWLRQEGLL